MIGGAFLVIDESYAPVLSVLFVTAAAALQGGSLLVAAFYLDVELGRRADDLAKLPYDEAVREADAAAAGRAKRLAARTVWTEVPSFWRAVLAFATVLMTSSCYLVTLWGSSCFRDFAINDTVSKRLKGDWKNIIRPLGVVACGLFAASCALHLAFHYIWYSGQADRGGADVDGGGGGGGEAKDNDGL